jgi:hypothetical protein
MEWKRRMALARTDLGSMVGVGREASSSLTRMVSRNSYLGLYENDVLTISEENGKLMTSRSLNGAWWKK